MEERHVRLGVVLALVALLFGLAVWAGTLSPAPSVGSYPGTDELAAEYDRYVGDRASVSGRVVATDPVSIRTESDLGVVLRLRITDLQVRVAPGDHLRIHGVVKRERTIRSLHAFAVPRWGTAYTLSISFLAGLWVLGRLVRQWRFDPATWALEPRASPRSIRDAVGSRLRIRTPEEESDA